MADFTARIRLDADNKQVVIEVVDAAGEVATSWGSVTLKLGKDPGTTPESPGHAMGTEIKLRETEGCDPETGDPRFCMMLRSEWYNTALTSDPET